MTAALDMSKGFAAIALRGGAKTAWHGEGQEIVDGDDVDAICKKAGLDYTVDSSVTTYTDHKGAVREVPNSRVNFRTDTGESLGIVSDIYHKVQPRQTVEFFMDVADKFQMKIETAGALRKGRTVWAMAKLGPDYAFMLPGKDKIDGYFRLQTSFDGTSATTGIATAIRQVCANTEAMINATSTDANTYKTSHATAFDMVALQGAIGMLGEQHRVTAQFWNELVKRKVNEQERDTFFCDLFGVDVATRNSLGADGKPVVSKRTQNMLSELVAAYNNGPGSSLKSANGTAYGLLQAVTFWTDHKSVANDVHKDGKDSARIASAWFGLGARTKVDAQYLAAKLAGCAELITGEQETVAA